MATAQGRLAAWEEFQGEWVKLLESSREPGTVVVVEGERDRRSLRRLGVSGRIVLVHRGRTLSQVANELATTSRRAVLLTDWDAEGGHLGHRIAEFLEGGPVLPDLETRKRLGRVLRSELTHVEGLYGWARRSAELAGTTLEAWLDAADPGRDPTG